MSKLYIFTLEVPICSKGHIQILWLLYVIKEMLPNRTLPYKCTVKPVLCHHSKRRQKIGFQHRLLLNAGQKYCRMLSRSFSDRGENFLAHRIQTSEILPWDRNLILPMLSYPGCHERTVHWLYWNSCTWTSSDIIV